MHFGVNLRPLLCRHALQHRTKRHRDGLCMLPNFFDGPGHVHGNVLVSSSTALKPALRRYRRQTAGLGKSKRIRPIRRQQRPTHVAMHDAHHALPIRLIERPPRQKARPRSRSQNAPQFLQGKHADRRKNITPKREVARSKLLSGKGRLCASACCVREVRESARPRPLLPRSPADPRSDRAP